MTTATAAASEPWYRSLNATQWKTVFASNLGWMFDGYETFSLILVVGVALHDLLAAGAIRPDPGLRRHGDRHHAAGLGHRRGDRRRTGRLYRPPPHHDLRDPGLFAHHGPFCFCLGLGVVRAAALPGRHRHRLGMVDRRLADRGSMAGQRARARRRADAMRARHRLLPGLVHLAVRQRLWAGCLAHHVLHRRHPGAVYLLAAQRRAGVAEMGAQQRKA